MDVPAAEPSYRRLFASERKHLPDVDLMRTGGWRDLATMKRSYQQADPATTLRVIENEPEAKVPGTHFGHTPEGNRRHLNCLADGVHFAMRNMPGPTFTRS